MKRRPRAALVVTFSLLAAGCQKGKVVGSDFKCEPPDCHMNPPPPPPDPSVVPPPSAAVAPASPSAAASAAPSSTPVAH